MGGAARELTLDAEGGRTHLVREVADEAGLDAWLGVAEDWGLVDGPRSRVRLRRILLGLALPRPAPVRMQVAWEDEIATGAISARRHGDVLVIEHLGVRAGSQRMGIGRALLAAAVRAEPDAVHVVLAPTPSSVAFYERLGFVLQRYPPRRSYYTPVRAGRRRGREHDVTRQQARYDRIGTGYARPRRKHPSVRARIERVSHPG